MASFVGFLRLESRISSPTKQFLGRKENTEVEQTTCCLGPLCKQGTLKEAVYTSRVRLLNSMSSEGTKCSPPLKAKGNSDEAIFRLLCKWMVHCCVHNSLPLLLTWARWNQYYHITVRSILVLFSNLHLGVLIVGSTQAYIIYRSKSSTLQTWLFVASQYRHFKSQYFLKMS
jgi:hypothetical protein